MIGVGVVGLGAIGGLHAENVGRRIAGARLVRVADRESELARAASAELHVPWSRSYSELLADPAVQAVVIATPSPLHAEMVERAAAVRTHVFCEKPLALDPESGVRATRAARGAGVRLQVGFQRRFDPAFRAVKDAIDTGEVGDVQLLRLTHRNRLPPHEHGMTERLGSLFVDMTIHDFDTARWLVGEVREVNAFSAARGAVTVLRFESGALGVIHNTRHAGYGFECSAEVMGSGSTLRIDSVQRAAAVQRLTPRWLETPLPADHIECHRSAYLDELCHFVRCVESGRAPSVGGDDAVAALRLSLAAERCGA